MSEKYSVLVLGASGTIGRVISRRLAEMKDNFSQVAFLTHFEYHPPEQQEKYHLLPLPRVFGSYTDPETYRGWDVVVSCVGIPKFGDLVGYVEAAYNGGVKHYVASEYGFDLERKFTKGEPFFQGKVAARAKLEEMCNADPSRGYTLMLNGMFTDFVVRDNMFFLSPDRKSANFLGDPEAPLALTHSEDIGHATVLGILPGRLKSFSERRQIRIVGSQMKIKEIFQVFEKVLGHPIDVHYQSFESSYKYAQEQMEQGNIFMSVFTSVRRAIGFGGGAFDGRDNDLFPELRNYTVEDVAKEVFSKPDNFLRTWNKGVKVAEVK